MVLEHSWHVMDDVFSVLYNARMCFPENRTQSDPGWGAVSRLWWRSSPPMCCVLFPVSIEVTPPVLEYDNYATIRRHFPYVGDFCGWKATESAQCINGVFNYLNGRQVEFLSPQMKLTQGVISVRVETQNYCLTFETWKTFTSSAGIFLSFLPFPLRLQKKTWFYLHSLTLGFFM